ncbi:MAG TPA: DNA alkylation repair protein [Edaphocola sp.]|nr:DNA alkylation repair protein [Edaphocola sp.]
MIVAEILEALRVLAKPEKAAFLPRFFKTGKGEYGEGDKFLGVINPDAHKVAAEFWNKVDLKNVEQILSSEFHEMRFVALLILVKKYAKSKTQEAQLELIQFYLKHTQYINNWDLVDLSCYKILGHYCYHHQEDAILWSLSHSENMWEKRIAIVGTMYYVKKNAFDLCLDLILNNLKHPHNLMHKANGWLLREVGKKDEERMLEFLKEHYKVMPRTSLRYAIEKLEEPLRQQFLKGLV